MEFIFNVEVSMVSYEVSALEKLTRWSQAANDLRKPAPFGRADVFRAECESMPDTRYVAVRHSGSAEEYVTNVSTSSPAFFTRHSVQGLCRTRHGYGHEAWLRMSGETPLFIIVDDKIVLSKQPPASIRVELNGRQLVDGQELKLRNKSVIEVRYAEVVEEHGAAYTRWTVLFSAQYLHLGGREEIRHQTEKHTRDPETPTRAMSD
jgi:hypothetical protein